MITNMAQRTHVAMTQGIHGVFAKTADNPFLCGVMIGAFLVATEGMAAGIDDSIKNVNEAGCKVFKALQGTIGIGIILGCFVIAGISIAIGNRNATKLAWGAFIGGMVILGARLFVQWGGQILGVSTTNATTACP